MAGSVLILVNPAEVRATARDGERHLRIYLRDHLAALHLGIALVRRTLKENREEPSGQLLAPVHVAMQEDLAHLRTLAKALGIRPDYLKIALARVSERFGRLKLNGHLRRYSPLSRVEELESLALIAAHRAVLWRVLERHARQRTELDVVDHQSRAELAERQRQQLEREAISASLGTF